MRGWLGRRKNVDGQSSHSQHAVPAPGVRGPLFCRLSGLPLGGVKMADAPVVVLLGVIAVCAVAATAAWLVTLREMRTTLARVNAILPRYERIGRDAERALKRAADLVHTAAQAGAAAQSVVWRGLEAAQGVIEQVAAVQSKAKALWLNRFGNGRGGNLAGRHGTRKR